MYDGYSHGIPIILSLYHSPCRYSQHCFIVMNSDPKEDDSTLVCFFDHQNTGALLIYTRKPVLDLVSDAWSTSTFAHMTKPMPLGSDISFSVSSFPTACPNSLAIQSLLSNFGSSISGLLGSYTNSVLWYFFKSPNICSTWSRCPFLGYARCADIMDTSKQILTRPNSTTHWSIPIRDW